MAALPALTQKTQTVAAPVDYKAVKAQLEIFQGLINRNLQQSFAMPFALLQDAKGTYLPEFGMAFHLEANLFPIRVISPFDMRPYTPEELKKARDQKAQRIQDIRRTLSGLLLENAKGLDALPAEQKIAIVVHLFNLPSEHHEDLPTQVVLETSRQFLMDAKNQGLTAETFQKQVTFLAF